MRRRQRRIPAELLLLRTRSRRRRRRLHRRRGVVRRVGIELRRRLAQVRRVLIDVRRIRVEMRRQLTHARRELSAVHLRPMHRHLHRRVKDQIDAFRNVALIVAGFAAVLVQVRNVLELLVADTTRVDGLRQLLQRHVLRLDGRQAIRQRHLARVASLMLDQEVLQERTGVLYVRIATFCVLLLVAAVFRVFAALARQIGGQLIPVEAGLRLGRLSILALVVAHCSTFRRMIRIRGRLWNNADGRILLEIVYHTGLVTSVILVLNGGIVDQPIR